MVQVKIFKGTPAKVEDKINDFLSTRLDLRMSTVKVDIAAVQGVGKDSGQVAVIMKYDAPENAE